MSSGIRSDASGTFGALTFGGDDAITFDATGIQAGSYKAGSIVDTDLTLSANSASVKVALNAAGDAPIFACRAWVNFNGTGTVAIRASGNVSSITDNGVGDYTVNFTTAMQDANYALVATVSNNWVSTGSSLRSVAERDTMGARTTSSVRLQALYVNSGAASTPIDTLNVNVAIFR